LQEAIERIIAGLEKKNRVLNKIGKGAGWPIMKPVMPLSP
jgi:hypothetical protein